MSQAPSRDRAALDHGTTVLAAVLTAAIFILDLSLPLGTSVPILYVVVVLLGLLSPHPRFPFFAASVATALTVVGAVLSPPGGSARLGLINRALAIPVFWVTALMVERYRRADRALVEQTLRAQQYLDVAGVIIVGLDAQGRVTLLNQRGREILGYQETEALGRDWFETFVPGRDRERTREAFFRIIAGEIEPFQQYENVVLTKDGRERTIAWRNAMLVGERNRIVGTLSSGEDVTERQQAEAELQRTLKDLADIKYALDQSAIVATTNTAGTITYANDKFCEISKYSREELLGQDHRIINSAYHPKEFMRDLWRTIARGQIWRGEIRNRAKDGSIYWVDTTIIPFLDARRKPYQYMAIRNEITDRKRQERLLREQETLARLGEMAAVVAHEVKNPIAGIRGALQIIGGRLPHESRERAVIGDIMARLDALNAMVQDLLLFSRPKAPKRTAVAINHLLESTAAQVRHDPAFSAIDVRVAGACPTIHADEEMLHAVFFNLLLNAAQAMEGRGTIEVDVDTVDGDCRVRVADHGPGIPADARERVFEPFFTTRRRGTGLGLPIAKRVIGLHAGTIALECPPGGGTVVEVRLPIQPPGRPAASPAPAG